MFFVKDVYAQVNISDPAVNPVAKFGSITTFVNLLIPILTLAGGFAALAMLLLGAFKYLTSEGNPEKIQKAQSTMLYALIGLFFIVASFIVTKIIGYVLKVPMPL